MYILRYKYFLYHKNVNLRSEAYESMNALGSVQSLNFELKHGVHPFLNFELNPWCSSFLEFLRNEMHLLNETTKSAVEICTCIMCSYESMS